MGQHDREERDVFQRRKGGRLDGGKKEEVGGEVDPKWGGGQEKNNVKGYGCRYTTRCQERREREVGSVPETSKKGWGGRH